jgi:hypothetical protein
MTMTSERPTPEQQDATARRFRGQRALTTPVVIQEATDCPAAPSEAQQPTQGFRKACWHWARWLTFWALVALIVAAIGAHRVEGPNFNTTYTTVPAYPEIYPIAHRATVMLAVALGVMVLFWLFVGMGAYLRLVWRTTGEAMRPVPSLAEIELEQRRCGYNPSIADVVAMHQYLTSQRNEAAVVAGALVIGPQLLARQAQGKPLL